MKKFDCNFERMVSVENLLDAWQEFVRGKRAKPDVQEFSLRLMDNILQLHHELVNRTYRHGGYQSFNISDPKPRNIHKANVRDRLLHHAVHRILYPLFDRTFIADSYSCRLSKGTHKAINRFRAFAYKASRNHTRTCWVLQCDVKKFFASVDHRVSLDILKRYISDTDIIRLLREVVGSFHSGIPGKGLPLGNLTSQLLANVYMNELDQFVKHKLKIRHYIRYADDFTILSENKTLLESLTPQIDGFLRQNLKLELHPDKICMKTIASGVDFLGWVHFLGHRVLRTATRRRMLKQIAEHPAPETLISYAGLLRHGNAYKLLASLGF
ncbi:MAG: hypothetical protein A3A43_02400 [Candidatus Liptonbacteria bacterium RIFCSPLOWO2_01_FULL_56_20]|uniref:Reverse transcriptase domain-containing protein n=1 Tax=Candidatus Liptonbacteria bacterium RIFCSPLOWO2_01_FULL_56_20 TaxID=1798652 RepID=A0A1G2CHF7_9BACT|nr:MAG: hypothetical protein A2681_00435 [Candidatus Liptonbacteria bacterium RIFCSPHIGHO2_01_FULL_56_18b]OGZ00825.1 MAG: hypothetical protein A3A43_02400 [Candidatus Liptonbacteria bacterium RIFCSPLOWO2_01_FULL_56_20]